jgi:hypothetical protein
MVNPQSEARALLLRMALISYGSVSRFGGRRGGEPEHVGPPGENAPMADLWAERFSRVEHADELAMLVRVATHEFDSYVRRQLAPDTTESLEELCARIVSDGWGVSTDDCARAMRCTPTLVRRARLAALRHPESGYPLPERESDPMAWARALDDAGLSLRQVEELTGVPKSTLHDRRFRRAA